MKKFSFLTAAFAVFFSFASCNLLSSDKISETGRAEFSLSPELARAVIDSLQADEGESNPHMTQNLSIEVKLIGEYSAEKSLQIDVTGLNIEQKSEDLKSKIEDKLTSQTIVIDSIPAGKRVSADVKVYLVSSHGDIQMKKDILVKGKSDPVTISAGDNLISVALSIVYRSYPVTFNLSFEKAGGDFTTCRSVDLYAVKADSDTVLKFFSTFAEGQGSSTDFYNILNSHSNQDCFTEAYWYKDSENKDIDQTAVTEDAMTLSGKIYLPFDEKIIVVALANFTGATDEGLYYICHVPGSSMDEVMSHAFVPDAGGNTVELKSNKLALDTQYVLYSGQATESGSSRYNYSFNLTNNIYDSSGSVDYEAEIIDHFTFDSKGYFYCIDDKSRETSTITIKSNNPVISSGVPITVDSGYKIKFFTIDKETDVFYIYTFKDGYGTSEDVAKIIKLPLFVTTGNLTEQIKFSLTDCIPDDNMNKFVVNKNTLYIVAPGGSEYNNNPVIEKFDVSDVLEDSQVNGSVLVNLGEYVSLSQNGKFTDILYQDGNIYILGRDYNTTFSSSYFKFYSRGLLVRYNIKKSTVDLCGWNSNKTDLSNNFVYGFYGQTLGQYLTAEENGSTKVVSKIANLCYRDDSGSSTNYPLMNCEFYLPPLSNKLSASSFYGPQKFIAIKPKKLVISDDGVALYADVYGALTYKNVNRVITVDLKNFSIDESVDVNVTFDREETGLLLLSCAFYDIRSENVYKVGTDEQVTTVYYNTNQQSGYITTFAIPPVSE